MTHALTTQIPPVTAAQAAEAPPADDQLPLAEPAQASDPSPPGEARPLEPMIAELLAEALTAGPHLFRGRFFDCTARATGDGQLVLDLRHRNLLGGHDPELNGVLLQVSIPPAEAQAPAASEAPAGDPR